MIHPLLFILLWLRFPVPMTLTVLSVLALVILASQPKPAHAAPQRHALHHAYRHER